MNSQTNKKYTLEDITRRKQEVLQNMQIQRQVITERTQAVFAPILPSTKGGQPPLLKKLNAGMAIFDGVVMGVKIVKNIRSFLKRGNHRSFRF